MATQSHEAKITVTTVDKSSATWRAITKEIKDATGAINVARSAFGGFIGGLASGAFQQMAKEIDAVSAAIVRLGSSAVEMKYLSEETKLSQEQILKFQYGLDQLGISTEESGRMIAGATGKIQDLKQRGFSALYNELSQFPGGRALAESLINAPNMESALKLLRERMQRMSPAGRREAARLFGLPERFADLELNNMPKIIKQNIQAGIEWHKAWTNLQWTFRNFGTMAANELTPVFRDLANEFDKFLKEHHEDIEKGIRALGTRLQDIKWNEIADNIKNVINSVLGLGEKFDWIVQKIKGWPPEIQGLIIGYALGGIPGGIAGLTIGSQSRVEREARLKRARELRDEAQRRRQTIDKELEFARESGDPQRIKNAQDLLELNTRLLKELNDAVDKLEKGVEDQTDYFRKQSFEGEGFPRGPGITRAAFHPSGTGGMPRTGPSIGQGQAGPNVGPSPQNTQPGTTQPGTTQTGGPPAGLPNIGALQSPTSPMLAATGEKPEAFIFHHTGGRGTIAGLQQTLRERGLGVEYGMDREGNIVQIGGAGASHMKQGWGPLGAGLSNRNTLGMEIIARNDKDVTPVQIAAAKAFMERLYPGTRVLGHGQVNPGHKEADEGLSAVRAVMAGREETERARQTVDRLNGARAYGPGTMLGNANVNIKVTPWNDASPSQQTFKEIPIERTPQMSNAGGDGSGWNPWRQE